ncbi:hypothetical protein [Ideonella livida]|uniref:Lipocalin-like domain-containing protein n=1 Tax=Ideonella livida TaxID=2707176 RepID=A0A7C9PKH6_9BURK|nr:hypothetical protein [Ideonella livida]NDY93491.1 hypothetical protein [Ideonella livida]
MNMISRALRTTLSASALAALALLSACGGSGDGDDSPAEGVDKYVGTWKSPCTVETSEGVDVGVQLTLVVTKTGANSISSTGSAKGYANTTCTGTAVITQDLGQASAALAGTKTVGGKTVDKATFTDDEGTYKDIILLESGRLYNGDVDSALDAEGYPTALDMTLYYQKQ